MAEEEQITDEQAEEALKQLARGEDEGEPEEVQAAPEPPMDESGAPEAVPAEEPVPVTEGEPEAPPPEPTEQVPDTASLETAEKRFNAQVDGIKQRYAENERILRDRYLRKSTSGDKLVKLVEAAMTEEGVRPEEARQIIDEYKGTMHPASASYVPMPAPAPPTPPQAASEDQAITVNAFLNEQGMTQDEAAEFGTWVQTEAPKVMSQAEQNVAGESLGGFLRLAHGRWQSGLKAREVEAKRDNAVGAVRSVQITQRAAARAAAPQAPAQPKQPAGPKTTVDTSKFTKNDISKLLRQSVEQYR